MTTAAPKRPPGRPPVTARRAVISRRKPGPGIGDCALFEACIRASGCARTYLGRWPTRAAPEAAADA